MANQCSCFSFFTLRLNKYIIQLLFNYSNFYHFLTELAQQFLPSPLVAQSLWTNVGNNKRLRKSESFVIKVKMHRAPVMPTLKFNMTVFHGTNTLQSKVDVMLLGFFFNKDIWFVLSTYWYHLPTAATPLWSTWFSLKN